jgi:hypothetical protein
MHKKRLLLFVAFYFHHAVSNLIAAQPGLFVVLQPDKNREIEYRIDGQVCSKTEFVKLAETRMKTYSGITPILLFNDRLSIADVANVGGLLGAIGFPMPRYFMFTDKHFRVVEISLAESSSIFDYDEFVKDPFGTVARKQK